MSFLSFTTADLFRLYSDAYAETTGEDMLAGSREHAEASVASYVLGVVTDAANASLRGALLSTATGAQLDDIADTWGITRPAGHRAVISAYFRTTAARPVTVPAGHLSVTDGEHAFYSVMDAEIPTERETAVRVTMEASSPGARFNGLSGTLSTVQVDGITVAGFLVSFSDGPSAGGDDGIPDTAAGDAEFREYIRDQRRGASVGGPAWAYEARVKASSSGIVAVYCLRDGDTASDDDRLSAPGFDYEKGIARICIITDPAGNDAIRDIAQRAAEARDFRPIGDFVRVELAPAAAFSFPSISTRDAVIVYPRKYERISLEHYKSTIQAYADWLAGGFGRSFSETELATRLCTPHPVTGVHALEYDLGGTDSLRLTPGAGSYIRLIVPVSLPVHTSYIDTGE